MNEMRDWGRFSSLLLFDLFTLKGRCEGGGRIWNHDTRLLYARAVCVQTFIASQRIHESLRLIHLQKLSCFPIDEILMKRRSRAAAI